MSTSQSVVQDLFDQGKFKIHFEALRELTAGRFVGAGANGGLFGGQNPWMESDGDFRRITPEALRRLRRND